MSFEIRPVTPDEFPEFVRSNNTSYGGTTTDQRIEGARRTFEFDRGLTALDDGRIVATANAFSFDLTLPGLTTAPVAGVSWVSVQPTHRRHGILTAIMRRQLDDVQARGEAIAILTASESVIYGRFGYGLATSVINVEIERAHAAFRQPIETAGRLRYLDSHERLPILQPLYDRYRLTQPGALNRTPIKWDNLLSEEHVPPGESARFTVAYHAPSDEVEGIVMYRVTSHWDEGIPSNTVRVTELIATTPDAYARLWRFILDLDLTRTVRAYTRPVDEPLRWLLADSRRLRVTRLLDDLWVRLVDVPVALALRRYMQPGRLTFAVEDTFRPQNTGTYQLDGGPDGAQCSRSTVPADLALTAADLGAVYLGGVRFRTLAQAGRVHELQPGAIARADAMFASDPAPYCATPF